MELQNYEGLDLPPEYCRYRDEGCEFSESCLNCSLPLCVFEEPGGKRRLLKERRASEMVRLCVMEGKGTSELARIFGVSQRTVQRTLRQARNDASVQEARNG